MSAEPENRHTGTCRCGGVRFVSTAAPLGSLYCHCLDCRKASGAPVAMLVGFPDEGSELTGTLNHYAVGRVARSFCATCGAPVSYRDADLPAQTWLMIGMLDEPGRYEPEGHSYYSRRLGFMRFTDDLPKADKTSVPRAAEKDR